jgi:hypothetical protein
MKLAAKKVLVSAVILCCAGLFLFCSYRKEVQDGRKSYGLRNHDYVDRLGSFAEFKDMQGAPLSDKFNDVLSVKLVYDIRDEQLYFVNSSRYRYHFEFCNVVLGNLAPLELYNTVNYSNTLQRQYYLANLNYYSQAHMYALEFSSEDRISAAQIAELYGRIERASYLGDSLKVLVSSDYLIKLDNQGKLAVPKVYTSDIYKHQQYQLLNAGTAYGMLRMSNGDDKANYDEQDIVVMKGTPVNVPVCAGIITNSYQTPLSHINILCHNRNIPSAVVVDVYNRTDVMVNVNKPVKLVVNDKGITIAPVSMAVLDSVKALQKPRPTVQLHYNLEVKELLPVQRFELKQKDIVGNKAAGFGELYRISKKMSSRYSVPEGGFAIPFYYYNEHLARPAIRHQLEVLGQLRQRRAPAADIRKQLKQVRQAIKDEPLNRDLLLAVEAMIRANNAGKDYRFRSSANAEDVVGFSAAGLYESKTGKLDDKNKPIDMAIKKVWASAYTDVAYLERMAANINESTMMMGVLCHRSFPAEKANGVAITRNIYRPAFPGFTVNVQIDEVPVVSPPDSVTCEQFICMNANSVTPMNDDVTADYITYSNINHGKPVLTAVQVQELYSALRSVKLHYNYNKGTATEPGGPEPALDIEFKFDNNGKLYLKQVRPYR